MNQLFKAITILIVLFNCSCKQNIEKGKDLLLWCDKPATDWMKEALPIGYIGGLENYFQPNVTSSFSSDSWNITAGDTLRFLDIPERPAEAVGGSVLVKQHTGLSRADREKAVFGEILSGNVPAFTRRLRPVKIIETVDAKSYEIIFYITADYLAIGSDLDYLYIPMTPSMGQYLADQLHCSFPTKKIVDLIYTYAEIKLAPQPIPPSDSMTSVPVFRQHSDSIKQQIFDLGIDRSVDQLIAGHKKDIIISNKIYQANDSSGRVVIYGWHLSEKHPIQPVYNGHIASYADYSHGVRLMAKQVFINGASMQIDDVLRDPKLSILFSHEGVISKPYYPSK